MSLEGSKPRSRPCLVTADLVVTPHPFLTSNPLLGALTHRDRSIHIEIEVYTYRSKYTHRGRSIHIEIVVYTEIVLYTLRDRSIHIEIGVYT